MKLFKIFILLVGVAFLSLFIGSSVRQSYYSKSQLEEFELLNLCHCYEYIELRNLDYVKWQSNNGRKAFLDNVGNQKFARYSAVRLYSQYFQNEYDSTLFFKNGYSKYQGFDLDFTRLDSLYYEPMVQHYVKSTSKVEKLPYLGFGDISAYFDCYYRVKEIPIEKEYEIFLKMNKGRID